MIFWTFGCEPIFSEVWRTLDCTSIIEFEINNAPYIIHRYKMKLKLGIAMVNYTVSQNNR